MTYMKERDRLPQPVSGKADVLHALRSHLAATRAPGWALIPLRLFLGVTFIYAGMQKLTDPQYFKPGAPGYIGKQIASFASGSPLHGLLVQVALPHAIAFGALVAYGEIAIGLGTLLGVLMRPAAFFGALLSTVFFLSASWRVHPYFYGADIVFVFGWIILLLTAPQAAGWPALDTRLAVWLFERVRPEQHPRVAWLLAVALGADARQAEATAAVAPQVAASATSSGATTTRRPRPAVPGGRSAQGGRSARGVKSRREFIWGLASGAAGMLGIGLLVGLFRRGDATGGVGGGATPTAVPPTATVGSNTATTGGSAIAQVSAVPANSAASFTIPANGDPGVLVHLNSGQFVAFDATCTHAGCPVQYDSGSQLLICPCHGAEFDPAQAAALMQGPAGTPLLAVPIHIDGTGQVLLHQ